MRKLILDEQGNAYTINGDALYIEDGTVPEGYERVQYISCSGKSAINTGIVVAGTDTIEFDFSLSDLSQKGDKYILSQKSGYTGGGLWVETYDAANTWYVRFGSSSSSNTAISASHKTGRHTIEIKKNSFKVDGSTVLSPNYSSMPTSVLSVGGRLTSDTAATGFYGSLYDGFAVIDSNGDFRWYGYTVKRLSDNAGGMYDIVSGKIYMSATPYDFTAGPTLTND